MASNFVNRVNIALRRFDYFIANIFNRRFPPEALYAVELNVDGESWRAENLTKRESFSLENIFGNGFLWAVPKHRRTVERRLQRKFGDPKYIWKPLKLRTNILVCNNCGNHCEAGILCGHCYNKVKTETKEMQNAIEKDLGLNPVDKDVVVLYDGEKSDKIDEYWKDKRIVELPKTRPSWFQKNLLQQTTQEPSDSKEVAPTQLA